LRLSLEAPFRTPPGPTPYTLLFSPSSAGPAPLRFLLRLTDFFPPPLLDPTPLRQPPPEHFRKSFSPPQGFFYHPLATRVTFVSPLFRGAPGLVFPLFLGVVVVSLETCRVSRSCTRFGVFSYSIFPLCLPSSDSSVPPFLSGPNIFYPHALVFSPLSPYPG